MPDNVTFQSTTPATPPDATIVAADDVSGIKYQVVKIDVGGDGLSAPLSSSNPVPVSDAGGSLTVDGSITANAGTNLNTSALALEATQASVKTAVETIDNFISGSRGLVTEDNSAAIKAAVEVIDNFISGSRGLVTEDNSAAALTSLQLIDDTVIADDAAFTPATTKVVMAGFEADESSTDSVDEGDGGAARMTLDRKVIVTPQGHTTGGLSTFMASGSDGSTALTSTAQAIKASAGQVYGYYVYNPNATAQFVHFYNVASASVTVGTTNPLFTLTVPATSAANLSLAIGITFSNAGFSIAATATAGGNGAPSSALDAVVWYM